MNATRDEADLPARVAQRLARLVGPSESCLLAVSGGPDSLALLDLVHRTTPLHGRRLAVGHVDHGISPGSAAVAREVARAAVARGLTFHIRALGLPAGSSETVARRARRSALRQLLAESGADMIVLAHHADDQAETVLLRLLHGSGPAGLAAMAPRRGIWVRPLLGVRRAELAAYLATRGLSAWHDPANIDPRHLRSWLREAVLPVVAERLPTVMERLVRSADLAALARAGWQQALGQLDGLDVTRESNGISVAAPVLQGYRSPLRHAVLAALGRRVGVLLGAGRLRAVDRLLRGVAGSGRITIARSWEAELSFGRLAFVEAQPDVDPSPQLLVVGATLTIGRATFRVRAASAVEPTRAGWAADLTPGAYVVRAWRPGDRITPLGGRGSRAVAVLLREAAVPPSARRGRLVVVSEQDATVVWVPGICRSVAAIPPEGTEAWHVECAVS
ncbi:MAG TPA: tRNA lysidine(34) synthetase TilS [Gemmatimonadales bacterium]